MTDARALRQFATIVGVGKVSTVKLRNPLSKKPSWRWVINRWEEVEQVLVALLPHLRIKHKEALAVLELTEWHGQRRGSRVYSQQEARQFERLRETLKRLRGGGW